MGKLNLATKIGLLVVGTPTLAASALYIFLFLRSMHRHPTLEHLIVLLCLWQTQTGAAFAIAAALLGAVAILYQTETTQRMEEARRKQAKDAELETGATEVRNLRQAPHTEVAMTASQCLRTLDDFSAADSSTKSPRSALMPRLVIYEQNAGKIGLLSRDEIVNLIRFSGELYDLSVVANDLIRRQTEGPGVTGDVLLLLRILAGACRYAADFMQSVPDIPNADEDRPSAIKLIGTDPRFWWRLLVCGILSGWTHPGSARGAPHERPNHKFVALNAAQKSRPHTIEARTLGRAAHGTHHSRPKLVAHNDARQRQVTPDSQLSSALAKPLIVIDAGHGGRDSGAVGLSGTLEKNVTLATALELRRLLLATGRYRVAMTRRTDTFVPLGERLAFVEAHSATLLISIHVDASSDPHAHGASVYIRSNRPEDATALPLATTGSTSITTAHTLAGIAPRPRAGSPWLQYTMIDNLDDDIRMTADPARRAHLYVLATGDIPSVLLEMGFLSNGHDEALIKQQKHRNIVARSMRDAIDDYFDGVQPPHGGRT